MRIKKKSAKNKLKEIKFWLPNENPISQANSIIKMDEKTRKNMYFQMIGNYVSYNGNNINTIDNFDFLCFNKYFRKFYKELKKKNPQIAKEFVDMIENVKQKSLIREVSFKTLYHHYYIRLYPDLPKILFALVVIIIFALIIFITS